MQNTLKPAPPSSRSGALSSRHAFELCGFVGPLPLFDARVCRRMRTHVRRKVRTPPADWSKGYAVDSRLFFELATCRPLLDRVIELLGDDVILWGASVVDRPPGSVHPWHTDIESAAATGGTVTAWIGLAHTNARSSVQVVSHSHRIGATFQEVAGRSGRRRDEIDDSDMASWARECEPAAEVVSFDMRNGDAVLFDGRLWHGSRNTNLWGKRTAILLQYATPETLIRVPDLSVLDWPFRFHDAPRPGCIVVSGTDREMANRLVSGPPPQHGLGPTLSTWIKSLEFPLEEDPETGWKPYNVFRGPTRHMTDLSCHVSVLSPGTTPHPPHAHAAEEILVMLSGEADLVIVEKGERGATRVCRLRAGAFVYYPAHQVHTITNATSAPATYLMFKWVAGEAGNTQPMETSICEVADVALGSSPASGKGFVPRCVLEGETRYLPKLHCHFTTLQPGAGYAPHVDAYDVAIVVRTGKLKTLGTEVGPGAVILYAAGESHDMQNVGTSPATYLVFEFHGGNVEPLTSLTLRERWQRWRHAMRRVKRRIPGLRRIAFRRQGE